jgi:hypothetical protein
MSVDAPQDSAPQEPCRPPANQAILPIVRITAERLGVYYREIAALEVAKEIEESELYDACGAPVKIADDGSHLEKAGPDDPQAVRDRILAVLAYDDLDDEDTRELRELVDWLHEAPTLRALIGGLGFAPVMYAMALTCTPNCTALQRAKGMHPPCCPKILLAQGVADDAS